jgi:hypothetical protein
MQPTLARLLDEALEIMAAYSEGKRLTIWTWNKTFIMLLVRNGANHVAYKTILRTIYI